MVLTVIEFIHSQGSGVGPANFRQCFGPTPLTLPWFELCSCLLKKNCNCVSEIQ